MMSVHPSIRQHEAAYHVYRVGGRDFWLPTSQFQVGFDRFIAALWAETMPGISPSGDPDCFTGAVPEGSFVA
jgi:hypothetical protein